jgi:ATP synthase protein I
VITAIGLQVVSVAVFSLVWGLVSDATGAWFLALGGGSAIVPNALFALRLAMHRGKAPASYPAIFFLGEFAKIGLTLGLLAAVIAWQPGIRWLPLLIGWIVALKAPLFALWWHRER